MTDSLRKYDLFISYAHKDNQGNPGDDISRIKAIKLAIEREYLAMTGRPVAIFLDEDDIRTGDDWRLRILTGLQSSKMMLAVLSENYFKSAYCKLEWEHYIDTELDLALPGEGIAPIYILRYPDFDQMKLDERLRRWARDLQRRQVDVRWLDWWPHGQTALERDDVARRLKELAKQLDNRLGLYEIRERSPTNQMPQLSKHFKGRRREMHELRAKLVKGNVGAIAAVNGVSGIGKTELALAYAWGYGGHYPGGRFYLNLAGHFPSEAAAVGALKERVAELAPRLGISVADAEWQLTGVVFGKVCKHFRDRPDEPVLFMLDNIDDETLLQPTTLADGLPQGAHVDVLLTTRLAEIEQDRLAWIAIDALETEDGVALLDSFVPIPSLDDEWKAAYRIAERLGGHALALNIVGVYLRWKKVSYVRFLAYLEKEGLQLVSGVGEHLDRGRIDLGSAYREKVLERLLAPTLEHLERDHPTAFRALQIVALCPPDNVPLPWIEALLVSENPAWAEGRLDGTAASAALEILRGHRLLTPIRRQTAGLVAETAEGSQLARTHRVYQDLILKDAKLSDREAIEINLFGMSVSRSVYLRNNWGHPSLVWELWPLLEFAFRFASSSDPGIIVLLDNIAQTLRHIGRTPDVERCLRTNVEVAERFLQCGAPDSSDFVRVLSYCHCRLGSFLRVLGKYSDAIEHYEHSRGLLEQQWHVAPDKVTRELTSLYETLGRTYQYQGIHGMADGYLSRALHLNDSLETICRASRDLSELASIYNSKGRILRSLRRRDEAKACFEASQLFAKSIGDSASVEHLIANSLSGEGDLMYTSGQLRESHGKYSQALMIREILSANEPLSAEHARDLAINLREVGDLHLALTECEQAHKFYKRSMEILKGLAADATENADCARDLFVSYDKMGDSLRALGDGKQARVFYDKALEVSERLAASAPENADYARDLGLSNDKLFALFAQEEDSKRAVPYLMRFIQILSALNQRGAMPDPADQQYLAQRIEIAKQAGLLDGDGDEGGSPKTGA